MQLPYTDFNTSSAFSIEQEQLIDSNTLEKSLTDSNNSYSKNSEQYPDNNDDRNTRYTIFSF